MKLDTTVFANMKSLDKEQLSFSLQRKKAYVISRHFFGLIDLTEFLTADDREVNASSFCVSNEFFLPLCETYTDGLTIAKSGEKDAFFHGKDKLRIPTTESQIDENLENTLCLLLESAKETTESVLVFPLTSFGKICKEASKFANTGLLFNRAGISAISQNKVYVYKFSEEFTGEDCSVKEFFLPLEFVPFLESSPHTLAHVDSEGRITLTMHKDSDSAPFAAFMLANTTEKDMRADIAINFAAHDYTNSFECKTQALKEFIQLCKPVLSNKDQIIPTVICLTKDGVRLKLRNTDYSLDLDVELPISELTLTSDEAMLKFSTVQLEKSFAPFNNDIRLGFYDAGDKRTHLVITSKEDPQKFVILSQLKRA